MNKVENVLAAAPEHRYLQETIIFIRFLETKINGNKNSDKEEFFIFLGD